MNLSDKSEYQEIEVFLTDELLCMAIAHCMKHGIEATGIIDGLLSPHDHGSVMDRLNLLYGNCSHHGARTVFTCKRLNGG
jgi:hypothetical protein